MDQQVKNECSSKAETQLDNLLFSSDNEDCNNKKESPDEKSFNFTDSSSFGIAQPFNFTSNKNMLLKDIQEELEDFDDFNKITKERSLSAEDSIRRCSNSDELDDMLFDDDDKKPMTIQEAHKMNSVEETSPSIL